MTLVKYHVLDLKSMTSVWETKRSNNKKYKVLRLLMDTLKFKVLYSSYEVPKDKMAVVSSWPFNLQVRRYRTVVSVYNNFVLKPCGLKIWWCYLFMITSYPICFRHILKWFSSTVTILRVTKRFKQLWKMLRKRLYQVWKLKFSHSFEINYFTEIC